MIRKSGSLSDIKVTNCINIWMPTVDAHCCMAEKRLIMTQNFPVSGCGTDKYKFIFNYGRGKDGS